LLDCPVNCKMIVISFVNIHPALQKVLVAT
jgi:hypothetical protein